MAKKITAVLLVIMMVFSFTPVASAAKPAKTFTCNLTSIEGMTATFDVAWSNYRAYSSAAYAQCYYDAAGTQYTGYMIGMGDVVHDGKVHKTYSVTGCTVVFGQNALIDERVQPISGKYCKIIVHLYDRKRDSFVYAESNVMQIP